MNGLLQRSLKTRITLFSLVIFVASLWALGYFASKMLRMDMQECWVTNSSRQRP